MKNFIMMCLLGVLLIVTGCANHSVHTFDFHALSGDNTNSELVDDPHIYKFVTLYDVNMVIPTFAYPLLFRCDSAGANCSLMYIQPAQQPGVITGLLPTVLQGAAVVVSADIVSQGLKKSGGSTTINQSQTGTVSSSSSSSSSTTNGGHSEGKDHK